MADTDDPPFDFPELRTERLRLRVLEERDARAVQRHFADPDVTRYMDIEPCRRLADALEIIRFHARDSGCRWGLFARRDGDLAGTLGYHNWVRGEGGHADIGFDLSAVYWGRGLMREALEAAIAFGFGPMGLLHIDAEVHPGNERSVRLLERVGFVATVGETTDRLHFRLRA